MIDSTISGNEADLQGGGITVSGNSAYLFSFNPPNKVAIANTTITNNRTRADGGGIAVLGAFFSDSIQQTNQPHIVLGHNCSTFHTWEYWYKLTLFTNNWQVLQM